VSSQRLLKKHAKETRMGRTQTNRNLKRDEEKPTARSAPTHTRCEAAAGHGSDVN
jgi:hypothetical protein